MPYKESYERAKQLYQTANGDQKYILESLFPELKDSKDEKIRKNLINLIYKVYANTIYLTCVEHEDMLAWLEKQGQKPTLENATKSFLEVLSETPYNNMPIVEAQAAVKQLLIFLTDPNSYNPYSEVVPLTNERAWLHLVSDVLTWKDGIGQYLDDPRVQKLAQKLCSEYAQKLYNPSITKQEPADKVEHKFHEGEWIVQKDLGTYKIVEVCESWYEVISYNDGIRYSIGFNKENDCHLWTIQDAKDGDVLATDSWLYMFKYTNNKNLIQFHCNFPINGKSYKWCILPNDSYLDIYIDANIHPATKEQRDMLFQKMHEAGYEWDAEKKELKHIDARENLTLDGDLMQADCMIIKQEPAWSEEDETSLRRVEFACMKFFGGDTSLIGWLRKTLKRRLSS